MNEANPITLVEELKAVLQRYITTTLPISRRYPRLGEQFRELLAQQKLVEGPYVEALPDFEKGESLDTLLKQNGGFVHDAMASIPTSARRLHKHQQRALELAAQDGKSLLVATGTGSGKTESFLYPIAHALLSDPEPGRPGVRALLIYPMNALANDQLYYRIAPLFGKHLKGHGITFGRYTGQVKANVKREEEEARLFANPKLMNAFGHPDTIPSNWLLTREEMLADPPKVLITNYAMLEHLLLLPRNEGLFSANALRFIVLDEIHTYHGAQAAEVAFLLRKLKNRLRIDHPLQVFGTSASLADGEEADAKLKAFASGLFGETVEHVVRGKRLVHTKLQNLAKKEFSLSVDEWTAVGSLLEELVKLPADDWSIECWNLLVESHGINKQELLGKDEGALPAYLEELFSANREVRRVSLILDSGGVQDFTELACRVFDSPVGQASDEQRTGALSAVIRTGMIARQDDTGFPLLPGRYHIAVNSIEGLAVLPGSNDEGWNKLKAARHYRDDDGQYFPLLTCRKCGQPYLEGYEEGGHLHNRRPDDRDVRAERRVFWLGKPVGYVEDEDDETDANAGTEYQKYWLDVRTGKLGASDTAVLLHVIQTETDEVEKASYVRKCPACGGRASGTDAEVVTRMHPGNESLGSVVTQRVLEALPAELVDNYDPRPALGRNLLAFSDNRQDAAFFAPYFERTAADIALRSAIRSVLKDRTSSLSAPQLAEQIYQHWQRDGQQPILLDANGDIVTDRQDASPILLGALGVEFCTPGGRRNSVEALGVVNVTYDEQKLRALIQKTKSFWLSSLPGDEKSVTALVHILLENIRRERALSRFHHVALRDSFIWGNYSQHRTFDIEAGDDLVPYKWLPSQQQTRHNRRTWYLSEQLGLSRDQAFEFLRRFWETLVKPPISLLERHLPGFALNGETIRFRNADTRPLYVCTNCGLMQQDVLMNKCTAFRCRGEVEELNDEERLKLNARNHYIATYDEPNHTTVRAREHTASLSTELRESIERDFAEKKLNLLSCTTTMEMGVDLGDLEAVVNLNVPPNIANYQQRTGRAGRRAQAAPFCVTVARNTNFDQSVIRAFRDYLLSSPGTPFIHLDNAELFKRHQFSVLLSHLLRWKIKDTSINAPSLKHLFGDVFTQDNLKTFVEEVLHWFESDIGTGALKEAEDLAKLLPAYIQGIAATGSYLRHQFLSAVREFAEEVCEHFGKYAEKMAEAGKAEDYKKAHYWQRMRDDFMGQFLVDNLSKRGLIPTYSFPVHSLSLEVINESVKTYQGKTDVALSRDASLGISEYAPGAEVVANGRIWESAGLAHYPKAFMPERWYVACPECFHVDIGDLPEELPSACSNCGAADGRRKRKFIEPHGFVTSYAERKGRDPGSSRRRVKPADEARLIAAPRDDLFEDTGLPFLLAGFLSARTADESGLRGTLFIANRGAYGEGYHRCPKCNYAEPVKRQRANPVAKTAQPSAAKPGNKLVHDDPQSGLRCSNDQMAKIGLDFVHRFDTDVRLLRFIESMPMPSADDVDPRRFHERLARTIAESLRLSATKLLDLYPGELRATYRLYGSAGAKLEVVLYDAVPGGAGYARRIGEPGFGFEHLLHGAITRLDCPAHCESGCRVCLCDYGNQRYWDGFERKAALAWIQGLITLTSHGADGTSGYVRWNSPSLLGLDERLANYRNVNIVARSLVDKSGYSEESLNLLMTWLQLGKTVNLYLTNLLDKKPTAQAPLTVYRRLHPYVMEGLLKIFGVEKDKHIDWDSLPRVFVGSELGLPIFRQHFAVHPVTKSLIAAPADIGIVDDGMKTMLDHLYVCAKPYDRFALQEGERMRMWELRKGVPREFDDIFSVAKGAYVRELAIRDPYCATPQHAKKLEAFLKQMHTFAAALEHVSVRCREVKDARNGYVEFYLDIERRVDELIKAAGIQRWDVTAVPLKEGARSFHDREMDIVTVSDDGCETVHRYFLTGGIDYLMDQSAETRIFYIRIEK